MIDFIFSNLFLIIIVIFGIISFLRRTGVFDTRRPAEKPFLHPEHQEQIPFPIPAKRERMSMPVPPTKEPDKMRTQENHTSLEEVGGMEGVGGSNWTPTDQKAAAVEYNLPKYASHAQGNRSNTAREGMKWAMVFDYPRALKPYRNSYRYKNN